VDYSIIDSPVVLAHWSFLFVSKRYQHDQIDIASCQPTRCTADRVCIAPHLVLAGVRVGKDVSMWHNWRAGSCVGVVSMKPLTFEHASRISPA
jgi:hypothetical protein